ncbi:hypothetical protein [Alteraurantiacibacter aquimixticola]|uniref:Uncharacterized protein n=1 Tax=Alteraurantiacibacter aquimixticola TaxID=2489173 RepID=A0A4T3F2S8_9SPHN|nr:hypothetical protein [Alteraurantiacibacter aquimixticola]TIX50400.1 hypothetical protein E5222_08995 [Alteraurantiacibacter aquimixticola]
MSIRFAAPRHSIRNRMDDAEARAACQRPANDNGGGHSSDTALTAALRHFADHGLAAARHARLKAKAARHAGDEQGYRWWLEICRTLDRRMAQELDSQANAG